MSNGLARGGGAARRFHGVEQRIQQIQRDHHEYVCRRVGALQLPRHSGRMRGNFIRSILRPHAIRFDVPVEPDAPDRIRIGISIRQMRPFDRIRFEKNHFCADLLRRAQSFGKRVRRFDGNIDRALIVGFVDVENHRHFREGGPARAGNARLKIPVIRRQLCPVCSANSRRRSSMENSRRPGTTGK